MILSNVTVTSIRYSITPNMITPTMLTISMTVTITKIPGPEEIPTRVSQTAPCFWGLRLCAGLRFPKEHGAPHMPTSRMEGSLCNRPLGGCIFGKGGFKERRNRA